MSRVNTLLGARQRRPSRCMQCNQHWFMSLGQAVVLPILEDGHGRVVWYAWLCHACFAVAPTWARARAIEPPPPREGRDEPLEIRRVRLRAERAGWGLPRRRRASW